ncbi:pantoate--beta-alanine ligase [uncultured Gammaproteobacteria bacterium]
MVAKLLLQALPDVALFGDKDYQQLQVIKRLVRDLDIPVKVQGVPTIRELDGLAMSSRNSYLTAEERAVAPELYRSLTAAAERLATGGNEATTTVLEETGQRILAAGFARLDYVELRDAETLVPLVKTGRPGRLLVAAWLGRARLIDNVPVAAVAN